MIAFIILFLPAVLSVWIWEAVSKTQLCRKNWAYLYSLNTILVNFLCFAVKKWILDTAANPLTGLAADVTPSAALNYLIMAIPVSVALALVETFVSRKVRLRVEEDDSPEENDEETTP